MKYWVFELLMFTIYIGTLLDPGLLLGLIIRIAYSPLKAAKLRD